MGKEQIRVLHLETVRRWRGGQQQLVYLLEHLKTKQIHTALVCQPNSDLAGYCQQHGLPYYPVSIQTELDLPAALKISSLCRREAWNILHSHSSHALSLGIWTKLMVPKLIHVTTRRIDFHIRGHILSRFKYRTSLVDMIVCISGQIQRVLLSDGIPQSKMTTIPSGIDTKRFEHLPRDRNVLASFGIPAHHTVIGTIASMVGHKDYPNLLQAARIVIDRRSEVSFCAVGGGPDEKAIRQLARDLDNRFVFAGFQNDVGPFLKSFDIFVLSSRWEGLGTSILDAQAAGLPVVATATGGIPEIVEHNRTGLLVPPGNSEALAEAMLSLIDNEDERQRLGQESLKTVERFSIQKTVDKNIALYDALLNRK